MAREVTIPDWVNETLDQAEQYSLVHWIRGAGVQEIEVTRDEFIALKAHLAARRGYGLTDRAARIASFADLEDERDHQQAAFTIIEARRVYRVDLGLLVAEWPELDAELAKWEPGGKYVSDQNPRQVWSDAYGTHGQRATGGR